jgi:sigma-B regulation protein RsbU (phosphoserine phosphatase)
MRQEAEARERELQTIRLGKEMDIARNIQASMVPRKAELPGYTLAVHTEPATEVGGDSWDLVPTALGNFLSIGDVSGHGLPSGIMALIEMAALHGVIQTHLQFGKTPVPSTVYDLVNKVLCGLNRDRIGSDKFMTKVLLVEEGGRFRHAGTHEIGLLYSRREHRITELDRMVDHTGFLGLSELVESGNSLGEFSMEPGDLLLLYTDGLIEAKDARGEQFGIGRVKAALLAAAGREPAAILGALRAELLAFAEAGDRRKHGGRLADDLTMVLLRRD